MKRNTFLKTIATLLAFPADICQIANIPVPDFKIIENETVV